MRLIDADRLLSFIEFDAEVISPEEHTAKDIVMMIKTAPTIDTVKHGKWIMLRDSNDLYREVCSVCYVGCPECSGKSNYCPNCGADMKGEEDGEEKEIF